MEQKQEVKEPGICPNHPGFVGEMRCPRKEKALRKANKTRGELTATDIPKWKIHLGHLQKKPTLLASSRKGEKLGNNTQSLRKIKVAVLNKGFIPI